MTSTRIGVASNGIRGPQGPPGDAGGVLTIVPGANVTVDATDPENPVITAALTGGSDPAAATHAATSKTTPVDADQIPISDSASSNILKKVLFSNLWAYIQTKMNAAGVAKLATARNINGVAFDGTGNITAPDATKVPISQTTTSAGGSDGYVQSLVLNYTVDPADPDVVKFSAKDPDGNTVAAFTLDGALSMLVRSVTNAAAVTFAGRPGYTGPVVSIRDKVESGGQVNLSFRGDGLPLLGPDGVVGTWAVALPSHGDTPSSATPPGSLVAIPKA